MIPRGLLPVALGTLIVPLDTALNVAFPSIVATFGLPLPAIQWVIICYVLTHGSLMLASGRIGDVFGHRQVLRAGLLCSAVAFVLCSLAPSYGWLLAARVLQGVGAALVIGCGPALVTSLYPEALRTRALAQYGAIYAAGAAMGPLLAGFLVDAFGWQAVFAMRLPIVLAALLLMRDLPTTPPIGRREPFDTLGAVLLTLAMATLLLAINRAGEAMSLPLAAAALLCGWGFVWRSARAPRPILNLRLFREPGFARLNLAGLLVHVSGFAVMLLVPFFLARILGLSALPLGLLLATGPLGLMFGSWLGGRLGGGRKLAALGAGLSAAGLLTLAGAGALPAWQLVLLLLVQGTGMGLFLLAYADIVTATMPRADRGVAGSLTMLARSLGIVLAATLLTLVFSALEAAALAAGAAPAEAFMRGFQWACLLAGLLALLVVPLLAPYGRRNT